MKKVIGAVVAGTLVAGMASADISFKLQSRVRPSLYTSTETYADEGKKSTLWDFGYSSHNDILGVYAKGENCGADVEIALENGKSSYTGTEATSDGSKQAIGMDGLYDAWMNWGAFKVSFGRFDSRFVNRYNKSSVEGGWADSDTAKYGVSNAIGKGIGTKKITVTVNKEEKTITMPGTTFLYDFNNATAIGGTKNPALIFDYTINADAAKVLLKGGFVASNYKNYGSDDIVDFTYDDDKKTFSYNKDTNLQGAGYVAEIDVTAEPVNVQAIFKMPTQHTLGFGLYADVKAVENLNLALGFTYGQQSEYDYYKYNANYSVKTSNGTITDNGAYATTKSTQKKLSAYAFDLRAFYKVDAALTVGLVGKYSSIKKDGQNDDKAVSALELIGTAQYVASDLLTAQLDLTYAMTGMGVEGLKKYGYDYFGLRPAVKISASKNAAITAGFEFKTALNAGDASDAKTGDVTKTYIAIPVVARVKL